MEKDELVTLCSEDKDKYRFGYNGQMKDNEIAGIGNSYTAKFWQYDPRLGRRWNLDPKPNPSISLYAAFSDNPILHTDVLGDTTWLYTTTLPGSPWYLKPATHSFIVVQTSDKVKHYFVYGPKDDSKYMGGSPMVRKSYDNDKGGYYQDRQIFNGKDKSGLKKRFFIAPPKGSSIDEFDKKVIKTAKSYGNNPKMEYKVFTPDECSGNCNSSTYTILLNSGVSQKKLNGIEKKIPGINTGFGEKRPWTKAEQDKAAKTKAAGEKAAQENRQYDMGHPKF